MSTLFPRGGDGIRPILGHHGRQPHHVPENSSDSLSLSEDEYTSSDHDVEDFQIEHDDDALVTERDATLGGLPNNFTKEDFQNQRTGSTIDNGLARLNQFATCIDSTPIDQIELAPKMCFMCVNSYTKKSYQLGVGPINDSTTVAENHVKRGFKCYYIHNALPKRFLELLQFFFVHADVYLTVFFTGHGASVVDVSGDEDDGYDEAMVFDRGHIIDDVLLEYIQQYVTGKAKILLLTDCCHSGSIWDLQSAEQNGLQVPPNVFSISAAKDDQTAKQTKVSSKDQGIFTYFFWRIVNAKPKGTPKSIESLMNKGMAKFKQVFQVCATSPNVLDERIFPA